MGAMSAAKRPSLALKIASELKIDYTSAEWPFELIDSYHYLWMVAGEKAAAAWLKEKGPPKAFWPEALYVAFFRGESAIL